MNARPLLPPLEGEGRGGGCIRVNGARPRLLFISPRFLFPLDEGGKIRTSNILRQMSGKEFDITLASPAPAPDAYAAEIAGIADRFLSWPTPHASSLAKALAIPGRLPISVATDRSPAGCAVVARALAERPEVVVADFPHAGVLLPQRIGTASVLFTTISKPRSTNGTPPSRPSHAACCGKMRHKKCGDTKPKHCAASTRSSPFRHATARDCASSTASIASS